MSAIAVTVDPDVLTVTVRDVRETDWPFIQSSWRISRVSVLDKVPNSAWYSRMKQRFAGLVSRGAKFVVACDPEDQDQILGWACYEKPILHYAYVKGYFRGQGIARQLLAAFADQPLVWCSDWTPVVSEIQKRHPRILKRVLPC